MTYKTRISNSAYQLSSAYDLVRRIERQLPLSYEHSAARAFYEPAPHHLYERRRQRDLLIGTSSGLMRLSSDEALGGFWKEVGSRVEFIPTETPWCDGCGGIWAFGPAGPAVTK